MIWQGAAVRSNQLKRGELMERVCLRVLLAILVLSGMFFLPAGTFAYWEAWVYLVILFIPMVLVLVYLIKYDPELLERRMRMKEKEGKQKLIVQLSFLYFLLTFLLPGFDKRFEWSHVPAGVVVLADILVLVGYSMFFLVLRENRYASRIIEVVQGQKVISTGPYALVRHPMYLGMSLMYISSPVALGSYWAIIPSLLIIPLLVARIKNEEAVLIKELEGYQEYLQKTKFRLFPGIW
jgi:protein-S-isoprenylcysteine O-methyltransferase Ste14